MKHLDTIDYRRDGAVAWITLNRPDVRNALNNAMRKELADALAEAQFDSAVRAIVLTGSGDRAFCAGADINEFATLTSVEQTQRHAVRQPIPGIRSVTKPVIAMVNGLALGGGFEMVLSCDLAIAAESARFGLPEVKVGVIPGSGGTQLLSRIVGEKRARDMIYFGRLVSAAEAGEWGIVNKVVPDADLRAETQAYVETLLEASSAVLTLAKLAIHRSLEVGLAAGMAAEQDLYALAFATADQKEAAQAFLGKRTPEYLGR
jgi:enoyl-CoA hydratase/carnithine racemase